MEQRYTNESSAQSSTVSTYFNVDEAPSGKYLNQAEMVKQSTKAKPSFLLTEAFEIEGQGRRYRVSPFVSAEQAKAIEAQSGIVLKTEGGKISSFLGGGAYGRVYVAEIVGTGQFCAVKIITGKLHESMHESEIQLKLTQGIDASQSRLLPLLDAVKGYEGEKLTRLYYILPLAALGSAADLQKQLPTLENVELKRLLSGHIAKGLLLGLWQMHRLKIYHLDVKLANLLINLQGKILVADFGTSEQVESGNSLLTPHKNPEGRLIGNGDSTYFPPEREHSGGQFDVAKADSYSAGAALWELVTGKIFEDGEEALKHVNLQNPAPNSLADLAKRLLVQNPAERWTVEQALNHPVFQAPDLHDSETIAVVLDFLKRFVQQVQLKARDEKVSLSLNELSQSQATQTSSALENKLKTLQAPFEKYPDIQEQLKLYLPLQGSFAREVKDPEKDCFALTKKTEKFLSSSNTVLVLLADGGSGKSLFTQYLATKLLKRVNSNSNDKPWLPLYIALGGIQHPENLLQEGLALSHEELKVLEKNYQLLLIADGYDEQLHWVNLYVQNQLHRYDMKFIITSRINALPLHYSPYFMPQVPGESRPRGYQEVYVQPFNAKQIDTYVKNFVQFRQPQLESEVSNNRLGREWLDANHYQQQIDNEAGLKELIQTPLLCRLVLQTLPVLASRKTTEDAYAKDITRAEVYEVFLTQWIAQGRLKEGQQSLSQEAIFSLGQRIALALHHDNRNSKIQVNTPSFYFDNTQGGYQRKVNHWEWLESTRTERSCLPLQEIQRGQYKFLHYSMQEFLLARHLHQELKQSNSLKDLGWNQLKLSVEEKDRPVLYFLGDMADTDETFQQKLFQLIAQSKTDKSQARAAANAITVLTASNVSLCSRDFQKIAIPDANLSGAILWGADFSGADLTGVNLQATNASYEVTFNGANLSGIRLGQSPWKKLKDKTKADNYWAYLKDERYLVIVAGKIIVLYDTATRKILKRQECENIIHKAVSDAKGEKFALISSSEIQLLDAANGWELRRLEIKLSQEDENVIAKLDPSGRKLVLTRSIFTPMGPGGLDIWLLLLLDLQTGQRLEVRGQRPGRINSIDFDAKGEKLALGGAIGPLGVAELSLWDVASGQQLRQMNGHVSQVNSVAFDVSGMKLASGSGDYTVRLWDVPNGKELHCLLGHKNAVIKVVFDPSGMKLASVSSDTVFVWDVMSGQELMRLEVNVYEVLSIAFDERGTKLTLAGQDKTWVWDVAEGKPLKQLLKGYKCDLIDIAFNANGRRFASAGDKMAQLWDITDGRVLKQLKVSEPVSCIALNSNGTKIACGNYWKTEYSPNPANSTGNVWIWDMANGQKLKHLEKKVKSLAFDAKGEKLALFFKDIYSSYSDDSPQQPLLLDVGNEQGLELKLERFEGHAQGDLASIAFDPSGTKIACGSIQNSYIYVEQNNAIYRMQVWDVASGKELHHFQQGNTGHVAFTFDPSGTKIASAGDNDTVWMWDLASGKELQRFQDTNAVTYVLFDPSGTKLASVNQANRVRIWDIVSGKCLYLLDVNVGYAVKALSWWAHQEKEKLSLIFPHGEIMCFSIERLDNDIKLKFEWAVNISQKLDFRGAKLNDVSGLSLEQKELLRQLGTIGKPAEELSEIKQTQPVSFSVEQQIAKLLAENGELQAALGISLQPEQNTTTSSSIDSLTPVVSINNNSEPAFTKAQPSAKSPQSLLFPQAKPSTSQNALQQWVQSVALQGTWTVERNSQNLSMVFNPQQAKNFALILTQLRSHLSQLPEWQKVVAHEQKDNTLLIRLQNEADAKDCEAKFKGVFGIEEYKFGESCAVS